MSYFANPYDESAAGFYFTDMEKFNSQAATNQNSEGDPVNEYGIEFIDGSNSALFTRLNITQHTLELWFEEFEDLEGQELACVLFLVEHCEIEKIIDKMSEVSVICGTAEDYAQEQIDNLELPEGLSEYIDLEGYGYMLLTDYTEFEIGDEIYFLTI